MIKNGTYLTVNCFRKEPENTKGKIECLGFYEVDLDKNGRIGSYVTFWDNIHLFQFLEENWNSLHLEDANLHKNFIKFWTCIPSRITGDNIRAENTNAVGTIFEPENILKLTKYILENHDFLIGKVGEYERGRIERGEEIERLKDLKLLLETAIKEDALIGFEYG